VVHTNRVLRAGVNVVLHPPDPLSAGASPQVARMTDASADGSEPVLPLLITVQRLAPRMRLNQA